MNPCTVCLWRRGSSQGHELPGNWTLSQTIRALQTLYLPRAGILTHTEPSHSYFLNWTQSQILFYLYSLTFSLSHLAINILLPFTGITHFCRDPIFYFWCSFFWNESGFLWKHNSVFMNIQLGCNNCPVCIQVKILFISCSSTASFSLEQVSELALLSLLPLPKKTSSGGT